MKEKTKKFSLNFWSCIAFLLILWFIISFFDVILHNNAENPIYLNWNLFKIVTALAI